MEYSGVSAPDQSTHAYGRCEPLRHYVKFNRIMPGIAVTGATGFVGIHLLRALSRHNNSWVRGLFHVAEPPLTQGNVEWIQGDIAHSSVWHTILPGCSTLIHLTYLPPVGEAPLERIARNIVQACVDLQVKRVIFCSTAVVAGSTQSDTVTETTDCKPSTLYEKQKFEFERMLEKDTNGRLELSILRPTAVFGTGGRNLIKLANDIASGRRIKNWLRSSLYGQRKMNLVCVENVAAALMFLAQAPSRVACGTYIVSDDEDPTNNFLEVEQRLMRHLGMNPHAIPPAPLPEWLLSLTLHAAGRSNTNPHRVYDGSKLLAAGFRKPVTFLTALDNFAHWYLREFSKRPSPEQ